MTYTFKKKIHLIYFIAIMSHYYTLQRHIQLSSRKLLKSIYNFNCEKIIKFIHEISNYHIYTKCIYNNRIEGFVTISEKFINKIHFHESSFEY